jgi:hypothetical protein
MSRAEFGRAFMAYFNTNIHSHQVWKWNRGMLQASSVGEFDIRNLVMPEEVMRAIMNYGCKSNPPVPCVSSFTTAMSPQIVYSYGQLAPLSKSVPTANWNEYYSDGSKKQQEVDNTMYTTTKTTANTLAINIDANHAAVKSDVQSQRDMILQTLKDEFGSWRDPKISELRNMFNLNAPERPKTFAAMVEAIKAGRYTVDQKKIDKHIQDLSEEYGYDVDAEDFDMDDHIPFWYGVTFTDLPKADQKGFDAAVKAWERAKKEAQEDIMVLEPAQGLAALRALRDWKPVGKSN